MGEPLPIGKWLLCSTALNVILGCAWGIQRQQVFQLRHMRHAHDHLHEQQCKSWQERIKAEDSSRERE